MTDISKLLNRSAHPTAGGSVRRNVLRGRVIARLPDGTLSVTVPGYSSKLDYRVPPSQWASVGAVPAPGADCAVLLDDLGDAWVTVFAGQSGGGGGDVGPEGPMGPTGPAGPPGDDGAPGPKGDPGDVGPTGLTGSTGPAGATGATGATGPTGPTGATGPSGQSAGKIFYLATSDPSDIAGYKTALESPSAGAEQTIVTAIPSMGVDVLVATFATDPGVPGAVDYPAGTAYRNIYGLVAPGSTVAKYHLMVYKRSAAGVETLVRDEFSPGFSDTAVTLQAWSSTTAAAGALLATDRLVLKLYAQRFSGGGSGSQVTTYFEGTSHTSQAQTTISAGAQGPAGAKGDPGPWRGTWNSATAYAVGDSVNYTPPGQPTGSYRRRVAGTTATDPKTDVFNWDTIAEGQVGATGATGPAGVINSVQDEGGGFIPGGRSKLNFVGAGVTVTDAPTFDRYDIAIPADVTTAALNAALATKLTVPMSWNGMRLIHGMVSASGGINWGAGFTVSNYAVGAFLITFSPAFSATPTFVGTCVWGASGIGILTIDGGVTYNNTQIGVRTINASTFTSLPFTFLAMGI